MGVQPPRRAGGEAAYAECRRQLVHVGRRQGLQSDRRARPAACQPLGEPLLVLDALTEHQQHPFVDQPARGEQQGPQGVDVGPVGVVHDHRNRRLLVQLLEHVQDPGPDADRLLGGKDRSRLTSSRAVLTPAPRMIWSTTP